MANGEALCLSAHVTADDHVDDTLSLVAERGLFRDLNLVRDLDNGVPPQREVLCQLPRPPGRAGHRDKVHRIEVLEDEEDNLVREIQNLGRVWIACCFMLPGIRATLEIYSTYLLDICEYTVE